MSGAGGTGCLTAPGLFRVPVAVNPSTTKGQGQLGTTAVDAECAELISYRGSAQLIPLGFALHHAPPPPAVAPAPFSPPDGRSMR